MLTKHLGWGGSRSNYLFLIHSTMTKVLVHKLRTNISKTYDIITGTQVEHTNIFCNICYQI